MINVVEEVNIIPINASDGKETLTRKRRLFHTAANQTRDNRAVKHPALRVLHKCAKSHLCPSWSAAAAASYGETIFFTFRSWFLHKTLPPQQTNFD
ncbi:hypothetical protein OUZ56_012070 [Daphnia magna]|uniref:Uncharacterized protein n=1 Tax=Daphnia magna TaxID=35525 RepID=A0ABQ9Z1Y3_9CRUS|nr:hypothetical protein OUZ56_012070 [Daphnia magna]